MSEFNQQHEPKPNLKPNISIAICTYNRADQLRLTLESLCECNAELVAGDEIIVIDNNSNDETSTVVEQFKTQLPVNYVFEKKQGLSAARNRALATFGSQLIVFFDDDITVMPECIVTFREALSKKPRMSFFGGKLHVDFASGKPNWLKSYELPMLNGLLGHYDLAADLQDKPISYPPQARLPYGACFALRRDLIDAVGRFDEKLGVKGSTIGRGEETDYFERAITLGYVGEYLPNAFVLHRFPAARLKLQHLFNYGIQKGVASNPMPLPGCITNMLDQLCKAVLQLCKGRRDRFYQCVINVGLYWGKSGYVNQQKDKQQLKPGVSKLHD